MDKIDKCHRTHYHTKQLQTKILIFCIVAHWFVFEKILGRSKTNWLNILYYRPLVRVVKKIKEENELVIYSSGGRSSLIDFIACRRDIKDLQDCTVINGEELSTQHHLILLKMKTST
jgi:hypothetical protein